jgi:acyl transferase domain-containing protein
MLVARLKPIPTRALTATYITNKSARAVSRGTDVLDDLAQSASHTVQWADAMSLLGELRVTVAIETLPGDILTGLVQRNTPAICAASVATTRFSDATYLTRRGASDAATDGLRLRCSSPTAVDGHVGTGDVRGSGGRQEADEVSDLLHVPGAT